MVVAVCRSTGVGGGRYRAYGPPGGGGPYGEFRGHLRLTIAVIIIAAVQRALREAPLRRYRQRLPCSRSLGVLQRGWGGQSRPPLRRDDAVCHSTICGGCRYRGWAEQSPAPTGGDDGGCHLTGVGGGRFGEGGTRRSRPTEGCGVSGRGWGSPPHPSRPLAVTPSCSRCGNHFPDPSGRGKWAAALPQPRFFRHTPRVLAPQAARVLAVCRWRRRRFGCRPQGEGGAEHTKNGPGWAGTVL